MENMSFISTIDGSRTLDQTSDLWERGRENWHKCQNTWE